MNINLLPGITVMGPGAIMGKRQMLDAQMLRSIPLEYWHLLTAADGFGLKNGIKIYASDEVVERNDTFEVAEYAPEYLAIGDDSGGRAIMIPYSGKGVYIVDQGSMDPDEMQFVSESLSAWVSSGCILP